MAFVRDLVFSVKSQGRRPRNEDIMLHTTVPDVNNPLRFQLRRPIRSHLLHNFAEASASKTKESNLLLFTTSGHQCLCLSTKNQQQQSL